MVYCNSLNSLSEAAYDFLSEVFSYNLTFSEVGMTDHLIFHFAKIGHMSGSNEVEVYKTTWATETIYGNDIDLFIERSPGAYSWYALQAKVMAPNGAYKDLKYDNQTTKQQWDKLLDHEAAFGSKTFYLLYSGESKRPPSVAPTRADCIGVPSIKQLGLGLVETSFIRQLRTTTLGQFSQLYFRHIFPSNIDPLRMLFCCKSNLPVTATIYSRSDIDTIGYERIYYSPDIVTDVTDGDSAPEDGNALLKEGYAPVRIIVSQQ